MSGLSPGAPVKFKGVEIGASHRAGAKSFEDTTRNLDALTISLRRLTADAGPDVVAIGKNVRRASEAAARAAEQSEAVLASVRDVVEPAGPAVFRFQQGLAEVAATARSLRHLVEKLDRDPAILPRRTSSAQRTTNRATERGISAERHDS